MYEHSLVHVSTVVFIFVVLVAVSVDSVVRLRRADVAFVRQRLLTYVGMVSLFVGTLLSGGPHAVLADLLRLVGGGTLLVGLMRNSRQQAMNRKERERQRRRESRPRVS